MSNLEPTPPPPSSSGHFSREKPLETEIPGPSINTAKCTPSSTGLKSDDRHAKVMENFKAMIFKFAVSSSPTKSLSPIQRILVEQRLDDVFPSFRTPDHPPYAAMIEAAIKRLGEEGTSNDEEISQFIRKEFPDLPWAHDTLLKHHLGNLCEKGSIVKDSNGLYMLCGVVSNQDSASAAAPSPCFSIDAYSSFSLSPGCSPSSSSWSSSSYSSSPRPRRKQEMYIKRRKKQRRRRGSKNKRSNKGKVHRTRGAGVPKRRQRRPLKQDVSEEDTETSDEHVMLEEKSEEIEAEKESKEECNEGLEGINQVRGKQRRIRKQGQGQETGLMIEIQLDNHEDMVDEGWEELQNRAVKGRKAHLKSTLVQGRKGGRPRKEFLLVEKNQPCAHEMKTDHMETEVSEEKYKMNKELADVVGDQDQVLENMHETLKSSRTEDTHTLSKLVKSDSVGEVNKLITCGERKECDNFEGLEEQGQSEGRNMVPEQDHSNGQKRRGRPPRGSVNRRKIQSKPTDIPGRPGGRPGKKDLSVGKTQPNEEQMDTTDIQDPILEEKTEVPVQKYDSNKEVTEVVEVQNQLQGNVCETLERNPAEGIEMVQEIEKSGPEEKQLLKQCNLVIEGEPENDETTKGCDGQKEHENFLGSEEKTQFEEPNIVPKQDQRNWQKRRGQLLNKGRKGIKLHMKHSHVAGRGRVRPGEKDIWVEETQANAEQIEAADIHEPMFKEDTEVPNKHCGINKECTEAVEDCSELNGNMHGTLEWSPVEESKMVKEVRKPRPVAEENLPIKQDNYMMEGDQQKDWCVEGFNEQKEHENTFDEEQNQSAKEKNEITFGENQPNRQENEKQNQLLEKCLKSVTENEVEVHEMLGQDTQIQEHNQSGGQYESITKTLLLVDVAQRSMDRKAIVLPKESLDSVLQEGKEISNESMEQQREIPGEEKVLDIGGSETEVIEQKPESSTAGCSQLKSVERSSQPRYLLQQQHEEEKPLDGQLCSHSPKSYNSCRVL